MNIAERQALNDILNGVENLAVKVDALEAILIRKGVLAPGELGLESPIHETIVEGHLAALRQAISQL